MRGATPETRRPREATVTSAPGDGAGSAPRSRTSIAPWALAAGIAAVLAFLPALGGEFVYDDRRFYAANEGLTDVSVLWRAFFDPSVQTADDTFAGLWRPLRTLSFALDRLLWGSGSVGPHVTNALLHGGATALLVALLLRCGTGRLGALCGALVFAFHPVQAECVAWVSSRGDLLALVGVLAALLFALPGDAARGPRPVVAAACGVAALLAKEQAVVWPLLAPLAFRAAGRSWREALRAAIVPVLCTGAFVVVRHLLLETPLQEGGLGAGPVRDLRLPSMLGHQLATLVLPAGAVFDWQMPGGSGAAAAVGALALALPLVRSVRVPALWFLAALVPTLFVQMLVPLNILVADRFLLFALPALALGVARALDRDRRALVPVAVVAACLLVQLQAALPNWASERALWTPVAERVKDHPRANAWLGWVALHEERLPEAVERLSLAVESSPGTALYHLHLGTALEMRFRESRSLADMVAAREHFGQAVRLFPGARQEGRREFASIARLAWIDLMVATEQDDRASAELERLLAEPRPDVPERAAEAWRLRFEQLTARIARFLDVDRDVGRRLAPRLRDWAGTP